IAGQGNLFASSLAHTQNVSASASGFAQWSDILYVTSDAGHPAPDSVTLTFDIVGAITAPGGTGEESVGLTGYSGRVYQVAKTAYISLITPVNLRRTLNGIRSTSSQED